MAVKALNHKKITKKRTARFTRWECNDFNKLDDRWRRPHGIDNRMRRRFRGNKPMAKIGYGNDKSTRNGSGKNA
jgi:large subunit ribosomal protein L32e